MSKPFVYMSVANTKAGIAQVNRSLDQLADGAIAATQQAFNEICEDMLSKAQAKIHSMSGDLEASGTVLPAIISGDELVQRWGFNKEYAAQRDQGGDIEPVHGDMLSIPLDPIMTATGPRFSSPLEESNLELVPILGWLFLADKDTGEFHWLLTPHVSQEGNRFVSGTVQEEAPNVAPKVAQRVGEMLGAGGGAA